MRCIVNVLYIIIPPSLSDHRAAMMMMMMIMVTVLVFLILPLCQESNKRLVFRFVRLFSSFFRTYGCFLIRLEGRHPQSRSDKCFSYPSPKLILVAYIRAIGMCLNGARFGALRSALNVKLWVICDKARESGLNSALKRAVFDRFKYICIIDYIKRPLRNHTYLTLSKFGGLYRLTRSLNGAIRVRDECQVSLMLMQTRTGMSRIRWGGGACLPSVTVYLTF